MPRQTMQVVFACLFVLAAGRPATTMAQAGPQTASSAITPAEARRAVQMLQDEHQRAEALRSLKAIADAAPASSAAAATAAAPGPSAMPDAPAAAPAATAPLEANGLVARMLRQINRRADSLGDQISELKQAVTALPALFAWSGRNLSSAATQRLITHTLTTLLAVFVIALALERGLQWLLKRPLRALAEHAEGAEPQAVPLETGDGLPIPNASPTSRHRGTLRRLFFAMGMLILDLASLALFFVAAVLLLRWLAGSHMRVHAVANSFVDAYVTMRVTMAVLRLLFSPAGPNLRLLTIRQGVAVLLQRWLRRIVALATFGLAIADAAQVLGAGPTGRIAFIKCVSLLVHISVVILIFRLRRPVSKAIQAPADATGLLASARNWLAQVWAITAAAFVMGAWFVWALGVEDGFSKLIHFIIVSGGVIIAARIIATLALGVVGKAFEQGTAVQSEDGEALAAAPAGARSRLADRYYLLVRGLISTVITICAIVALFQFWGLDAIGWFSRGSIGRSLASALMTIVVAVIVAALVWEAASFSVERRLVRWQRQGDLVRAARLRTLLPMLQTGLFIIVVLIVGLTALNELGINTTPLLAGASILGVALGFGSQKLVQDFITGIFLLMENAMQVGDWVTVAGLSGTVEYLSIRTVRLRGGDGSLYIVPFSSVSTVNNTNRGVGNAAVRISVGYDTDIGLAIDELKGIGAGLRSDPAFKHLILKDLEVWGVDAVDGSMVTLAGQMRCSDKGRWSVQREINRRILQRFRELGIQIANPHTRLLVPSGQPLPDGPPPGEAAPAKAEEPEPGQK